MKIAKINTLLYCDFNTGQSLTVCGPTLVRFRDKTEDL